MFLIFIIGFLGRIFIVNYFNIDVFYDYTSLYSILYYVYMAIISISLSEIFTTLPDIGVNHIVRAVKDIVISIYCKCHMTLNNSSLDTKSYKEIRSINRRYIHAMDGNGANSITNSDNNLGESSRFKGKFNMRESDMVPVDPNAAKLAEILEDLEYKDSIIKDKKINNTEKLKRLQMSDYDPGKSDSSSDADRVKEIERVLYLKRRALESNMDPDIKLEILETLSDKVSKVHEEKVKGKLPVTNLEQNPLISSQSYQNLGQVTRIPRDNTAPNLNTGTEQVFSSPPRAPHAEMSAARELPSVVLDIESKTISKSLTDKTKYEFVNQDNKPLFNKSTSDQESSIKSKLKDLFKRKK